MACRSWTETGESRRLPADLVGRAVARTSLDAAAGHPDEEAVGIVVAAVAFLGDRHAAELAAPDDERGVEQPALLEVGQQAGDRLVGFATALAVVVGEGVVRVPLVVAVDLHEPDAALDQPPGQQALLAVGASDRRRPARRAA